MLTDEERQELLRLARQSVETSVRHRQDRVPGGNRAARQDVRTFRGRLAEPGGAFVTIHVGADLRGCIGYIESPLPLGEVVWEVAEKAALEDPRFPPMTETELGDSSLEVSVLSPLRKIVDVNEIQVGTHGILLELGHRRGLLLPQVATEQGWDRQRFLEGTARKAGLPRDAWKDPEASLYIFSADIVQEEHHVH